MVGLVDERLRTDGLSRECNILEINRLYHNILPQKIMAGEPEKKMELKKEKEKEKKVEDEEYGNC